MMKRGQSALEYLVTYGWAILAIVIIAAVLWYTGIFNPSKIAGGGKTGGGFGVFTYSDHTLSSNASTVVVGNAVGRQITVNAATVAGTNCNTGLPVSVSPNGLLTISCSTQPGPGGLASGAAYDYNVTVNYTDSQSGLQHVDTGGYIRGKVE